jgi:hypothetical protein
VRIRTGKLRVAVQNGWYTARGCRVPGDVCTIGGSYLIDLGTTPQSDTFAKYIALTQTDVENQLAKFLAAFPQVRTNTRGTIILDMEHSAEGHSAHPDDLHLETDADKGSIIQAWKRRQAAARTVFPYARITQYGVVSPVSRGDPLNATWIARLAALVQAGTTTGYGGVGAAWDALDFLSPLLYNRYGPTDGINFWPSYDDRATTCLTGCATIKRSNGASIDAMPQLNTYIANGGSAHNDANILDLPTADPLGSTWGEMFRIFRDFGVAEVHVWNGLNSRYAVEGVADTIKPSSHLLDKFIHAGRGWG